jgi:Flp pilus assembly protein TadG
MVHRPLSPLGRRDDGAVAILTILLTSVVFIGLCALVVDLGMARDTRRQAQNAADASVLAAGNVLYRSDGTLHVDDAVTAAKAYAAKNYNVTNWTNCFDPSALAYQPDLIDNNNTCISFGPDATKPTTVRVKVPIRAVSTPFAGIWGVSSVPVSAVAQIGFDTGGLAPCGLCVLGSGTHSLQEGNITVNGASVAINGTLNANNAGGSITVTGDGMGIDLQGPLPAKGTYLPQPVLVNQPPIVDPLASLAMPDYTAFLPVHAITNACPGVPGIYDHLSACGGMTPGLYVLTGVTGGNFGIVGSAGVTLDLVCSTSGVPRPCATAGEVGGSLSFSGGGYLNITAPAATALNPGLVIVADRNNTATLAFGGNGAANSGTIYAARGTLQYNGNGALGTNSLIVVNDFSFAGSPSAFVSSYTQDKNVTVPPSSMHLSQ